MLLQAEGEWKFASSSFTLYFVGHLSLLSIFFYSLLWRSSYYHSRSRGCEFEGKEARNKHQHQLIYLRGSEWLTLRKREEAICVCEGEDTLDIQITAWSAQIVQGAPVRNAGEKKWIYKIALPNVHSLAAHLSSSFVSSFVSLFFFSSLSSCRWRSWTILNKILFVEVVMPLATSIHLSLSLSHIQRPRK